MTRFPRLLRMLTGESYKPPSEREKLLADIAIARAKHQPVKAKLDRLKAITHAELRG